MRHVLFFIISLLLVTSAWAQYPPQAGVPGSTAISPSSSVFVAWASGCTVQRGYICIDSPSLGAVTYGTDAYALGAPDHSIVSLGDSGVADITFPGYIYNGPGDDFAVFENGFINAANDSQAFLELAFVEVSSDGINYTRFPAHSLTQTNTQVRGSGDYMYANLLHNLAGKYGGGYGTPFDLDSLPTSPHLDINRISHVRLVDVVGSIGSHASHDAEGRVINDPYITNFPTGGFDLDAVGIIHRIASEDVAQYTNSLHVAVYPNPVGETLHIDMQATAGDVTASLISVTGTVVQQPTVLQNNNEMSLRSYPAGLYYLIIKDSTGRKWVEKIIKN